MVRRWDFADGKMLIPRTDDPSSGNVRSRPSDACTFVGTTAARQRDFLGEVVQQRSSDRQPSVNLICITTTGKTSARIRTEPPRSPSPMPARLGDADFAGSKHLLAGRLDVWKQAAECHWRPRRPTDRAGDPTPCDGGRRSYGGQSAAGMAISNLQPVGERRAQGHASRSAAVRPWPFLGFRTRWHLIDSGLFGATSMELLSYDRHMSTTGSAAQRHMRLIWATEARRAFPERAWSRRHIMDVSLIGQSGYHRDISDRLLVGQRDITAISATVCSADTVTCEHPRSTERRDITVISRTHPRRTAWHHGDIVNVLPCDGLQSAESEWSVCRSAVRPRVISVWSHEALREPELLRRRWADRARHQVSVASSSPRYFGLNRELDEVGSRPPLASFHLKQSHGTVERVRQSSGDIERNSDNGLAMDATWPHPARDGQLLWNPRNECS